MSDSWFYFLSEISNVNYHYEGKKKKENKKIYAQILLSVIVFMHSFHIITVIILSISPLFAVLFYSLSEFPSYIQVSIKVKVIAGCPVKQVILQELMACNAAWVVLDR